MNQYIIDVVFNQKNKQNSLHIYLTVFLQLVMYKGCDLTLESVKNTDKNDWGVVKAGLALTLVL